MKEKLRFLGMDVHAETIAAAIAEPDGEVRSLGTIPNRMESVRKLIKKLGPVEKLRVCYEAGPTGYVLYWQLAELAGTHEPRGSLNGLSGHQTLPDAAMRDHRQLLMHRHKLVQIRTRVKNELQHLMLNQGMQKKQKLWSTEGRAALASLSLEPWTDRRRKDLLNLLAMLDAQLESLNDAVTRVAKEYPGVPLLMSQPGVGAVTALAFVLTLGDVHRFPRGKQVASYLGLVPREHSSGGKQRMGGISKQGNRLLRFLLVEAANIAVRFDPDLRKEYLHRCHQKHFTVAKVATARKLAVRMYWMLRTQTPYPQVLSSRVA
jgi:transposase